MHVAAFDLNVCTDGTRPDYWGDQYYNAQLGQLQYVPTCHNDGYALSQSDPNTYGEVTPSSGWYPYEASTEELGVQIVDLMACVKSANAPACTLSTDPLVKLTPAEAKGLIMEDPFVATALGYIAPPAGAGKGQSVDPTAILGAPGTLPLYKYENTAKTANTTQSQGATLQTLKTWSSHSSFATSVETSVSRTNSIQASFDMPIDLISIGAHASASWTNGNTAGAEFDMSFGQEATTSTKQGWLASADLVNNNFGSGPYWPNNVSLYLDPRFNTIMFRVVPPAVSSVTVKKVGTKATFTINDLVAGTALDSGELDVYVCPHGSTTGCLVAQRQLVMADAVTGSSNKTAVQSSFLRSKLTSGKRYDIYVSSPGGLTAAFPYTYH